jgi:prephenate dehydrogenase
VSSEIGSVRIVGAGLLGTSIGLALSKLGVDVSIDSKSRKSVELACEYGAGRPAEATDKPQIVVVCVPPQLTAAKVLEALEAFPDAVVTDVASVKGSVLKELTDSGQAISRYVGSHPMAGRERGGAIAGRADLFVGRPWVITSTPNTNSEAAESIRALALTLGAAPVDATPEQHDRAVALVSHAPQLISSLLASRLVDAEDADLALAGQGLRDTTRIAASDGQLWKQIIAANAEQILPVLENFAEDLVSLLNALANADEQIDEILEVITEGNLGVSRIPGKHGGKHADYAQVVVMVDDKPGELARLLTEVGQIGINLEELKLEHSPSAQMGLVELYVLPSAESKLIDDLVLRGWRIAG